MRGAEGSNRADGDAASRDPALDELREAYESGQLIVFAGGGVPAPLFEHPDLVKAAIAGNPPDLTAMGLDTYPACARALIAERERLGLVRRRRPTRPLTW